MLTQRAPRVVVFAGPNGAGKSTHADAILASLRIDTFVNADYIARGLSGRSNPHSVSFEAGRIMLRRLRQLAAAGEDFSFESTLSSRTVAPFLRRLKAQGYRVAIYYFSLSNIQLAVRRVKLRVALGGHDVPPEVVRRRFTRSVDNFFTPSPKALQKALEKSALQAQRLADAFGMKVPMAVQRRAAEKPQAVA